MKVKVKAPKPPRPSNYSKEPPQNPILILKAPFLVLNPQPLQTGAELLQAQAREEEEELSSASDFCERNRGAAKGGRRKGSLSTSALNPAPLKL